MVVHGSGDRVSGNNFDRLAALARQLDPEHRQQHEDSEAEQPEGEYSARVPRLAQRGERDLAPEEHEADRRRSPYDDHGSQEDRLLQRPREQPSGQRNEDEDGRKCRCVAE